MGSGDGFGELGLWEVEGGIFGAAIRLLVFFVVLPEKQTRILPMKSPPKKFLLGRRLVLSYYLNLRYEAIIIPYYSLLIAIRQS